MDDPFLPQVGAVLSADIAVPEHEREVRFYSRVLSTGTDPLWRQDLMNNRGLPIIGLGERTGQMAGLPLQWMPHIQVSDVAGSVGRTLALGGSLLMETKDEAGESLWAVLQDPGGAAFGIIPVVPREAIPPEAQAAASDGGTAVGRIAWLDLTVPDAATLRDFYREVVGWSVHSVEMEDGGDRYADYGMLGEDGKPAAGVCHARGVNRGLPPVWLLYLPVGDFDESLRRVSQNGGTVLKETRAGDGGFTFAVIQDPVGACVALMPG